LSRRRSNAEPAEESPGLSATNVQAFVYNFTRRPTDHRGRRRKAMKKLVAGVLSMLVM